MSMSEKARSWGVRASALILVGALNALIGPALLGGPVPASAADPCVAGGNKIVCENSKPGTDPEIWDIEGAGADSIQGFATDISVNVGQRIDFKIKTDASAYTVDIYRMGYYAGLGARKVGSVTPSARLPQTQPQCITDLNTDLYDCGNWGVSASWNVPSTAVSGVYIAHLKRSNGDASHITFIVRDDASTSDVVFQTSDPTWQAYNMYGGGYFYGGGTQGRNRAYKISYNRPVLTRGRENGRDFYMSSEYAMTRFIERNGYDVTYIAGVDTDRRGQLLTNHKVFLSVGHDEYWSKAQRANVEAARDAGVDLQFLAGNEVYWKTRYEPSIDPSRTSYRTLVSYKETWGNAKIDPDSEWTGTWRDPRFAPASRGGGKPENSLVGTQYQVNFSDLPITVSASEGKYRLWRSTSLASMSSGSAALAPHTVGYESNEDVDNGSRPAGLVRLSTTNGAVPEYLQDFGNTTAPGTTRHNLTMYKAPSGALVFSAGTIQWAWGLDSVHDSSYAPEPADARMQQAQVNLFADMGVQPGSLMPGLVRTTASTDQTAPTVSITSPAAGTQQANGTTVTVAGTAADVGGRVAGVEVSTDEGATWHAATGTTSWTYSFIQTGVGATPVRVRAMDDSANIGTVVSRSFTVNCSCSVFGNEVPRIAASDDAGAVELGLRFTPISDGSVTGVRFYKGTGNSGTHVGSLWSTAGERLAQVTFTGETSSGWQKATFSSQVQVTAGKTYVVSYTAPAGRYAYEEWAFSARGRDAGPLSVAGGFGSPSAGVFGVPGSFPNQSWKGSQYFVDVQFATTSSTQLIVLDQWPVAGASSTPTDSVITAKYSKPLQAGTAAVTVETPAGVKAAGTTTYDPATRIVRFTPTSRLDGFVKYTVKVTGKDLSGASVSSGGTWSFTTVKPPNAPGVCPCSLFDDGTVPTLLEDADRVPVSLGVRFTPQQGGVITGVKFYKGPNNTGTHTGAFWAADGTQMASGTFASESTTGWQTLTFATPVTVRAGREYIASYRTDVGRYSATPNAFEAANLSRPPLTVGTRAGAYTYGSGFPSQTSPTSYLVDVNFEPRPPSIAMTLRDPAPGAVDIARSSRIRVGVSEPLAAGYSLRVRVGQTAVAGTVVATNDATLLTFTPSAKLPASSVVTVELTDARSVDGAVLGAQSWTFRTRDPDSVDAQTMFGDEIPTSESVADGAPVEVGTAFTPSRDGTIKSIRFYRGPGNDGPHTGSLWSSTGTRLATVAFAASSSYGWQTANLATPLAVEAGQTYVVSYYAPTGHYALTNAFFSQPWTAGDLTAPATGNGRYVYGTGGGFPANSWNSANYFVDVVFARSAPTIAVVSKAPAEAATDVSRSADISLTMSRALAPGWSVVVSSGGEPVAGSATLSGDGRTITFDPASALPPGRAVLATVRGLVSEYGATVPDVSWTFTTIDEHSLLDDLVPAVDDSNDSSAVELGMAFSTSRAGSVTAIRFYKGYQSTGVHTGSLWTADGLRLATVTFQNETAHGWQRAALSTPVELQVGQTYVVSYLAPNGRYSLTGGYFASPVTNGALSAATTNNGRYFYGAGGGFPSSSYNAANYFVDVVFRPRP